MVIIHCLFYQDEVFFEEIDMLGNKDSDLDFSVNVLACGNEAVDPEDEDQVEIK